TRPPPLGFGRSALERSGAVLCAEELELLDDHRELAALRAGLGVFPSVVLQPAFDEEGLALMAILVDNLGLLAEGGAVDEASLLLVLAGGGAVLAIRREAEIGDR